MKIKEKKKAISLIVLVITVIVLSILAATVIVSISDTDVISETNKTVFKADMANYKEVYEMYVTKETLKDISFDKDTLNLKYGDGELNDIFNNLPDKYKENFAIIEGELAYITENETEKEVLEALGIRTSYAISNTKSYIGYYADTDGDGEADGVIFADLANNNGSSYYSAVEDIATLKDYVICKSSYTAENAPGFGEYPVLSVKKSETAKSDRFYVMAFEDITANYWYYNAMFEGSTVTDKIETGKTSNAFGAGKQNTDTMVVAWNKEEYGTQKDGDVWGAIQNTTSKYSYSNGWFVPSYKELVCMKDFMGLETGILTEQMMSFGLGKHLWGSSGAGTSAVILAFSYYGNTPGPIVQLGTASICGSAGSAPSGTKGVRMVTTF